jgi:ABC-type transporter Mla MlaB component
MSSGSGGRPWFVGSVVLGAGEPDPEGSDRVRALLAAGADVVDCDVGALVAPDARVLEELLRLALTARRCGGSLRLLGVPDRLRDLLTATGLDAVVDVPPRPPEPGQPKNTSASA